MTAPGFRLAKRSSSSTSASISSLSNASSTASSSRRDDSERLAVDRPAVVEVATEDPEEKVEKGSEEGKALDDPGAPALREPAVGPFPTAPAEAGTTMSKTDERPLLAAPAGLVGLLAETAVRCCWRKLDAAVLFVAEPGTNDDDDDDDAPLLLLMAAARS